MSTTDTSAHECRSTHDQTICKLELQQLTISPVDNHCINISSAMSSTSSNSSNSPTYTLSTPTTPPSPLGITPTLFSTTNNGTGTRDITPQYNGTTTTTQATTTTIRSIASRPHSSRVLKSPPKQPKKKAKTNAKSCKTYHRYTNSKRSHTNSKMASKPTWNHTSRSNERSHTKKKKKNKQNIKKHQRFKTATKVKPHAVSNTKKIKKAKKKAHKKKRHSNARKHLQLQTSYSERSRVATPSKKNYYYYSNNPCDIFNEKPMARRSSQYTRQIQTEKCKKKKEKKGGKKKKKKIQKNGLKPRRKRRPLSSRVSDKTAPSKQRFEEKMDGFESNEGIKYLNYEIFDETPTCSPVEDIERDLEEMLGVLKQDREHDIGRLPLKTLSLSHSLSDRVMDPKRVPMARHKRRSKSKRKSKIVNNNRNNTSKRNLLNKKRASKSNKKKKNSKKNVKKLSLKPYHSNKSHKKVVKREKQTKRNKKPMVERINADSNHFKNAKSMEITLSYSEIARGLRRPATCIPSSVPAYYTKMSDTFPYKSPSMRLSKSQHTTPTSPFCPNKPIHIDTTKTDVKGTNVLRRNTIVLGKKKKRSSKDKTNVISLGALSHYFQYHANHETKSILAHLAAIIMELVGEPNVFNLHFEVLPHVEMAIRRNKLRISPILRRGLVLSFAMHSVPKPLHNEYDDNDNGYISPLMDHTWAAPDALSSSDIPTETSPPARDLPESDLGLTSTDDDEEDNEDEEERKDATTWQSDGYDTSHFIDCNSSASTRSASPPTRSTKSKSVNGNHTLSPKSLLEDSLPVYGLAQSHTKSTNTPTLSPHLKMELNPTQMKHTQTKSNSDIFTYESAADFDNVELLRNDKKHLYNLSNGSTSFSSFSIDSHITYNDEPSTSYNHEHHAHNKLFKSFGSDMTVLSNISNTTLKDDDEREHPEDGMVYFDDAYPGDGLQLKLEQKIRTPFSNSSSSVRTPMFDIEAEEAADTALPDPMGTALPSFGYSSSTNNTLHGSSKSKSKSISIMEDACDLSICATNVRVPSPDHHPHHPVLGVKSRHSAKILLSHTSNTGDDSECIPYSNYDDDENENNDGNTNGNLLNHDELEQLQLSIRSSTYSIPGIGTIQVTTPGNQHTHTIFDKEKENKTNEEDPLVMIEDGDENEEEEEAAKDENEVFEDIAFPYYQWKSMQCEEEKKEEKQDVVCNRRRRIPTLTRKNSNSRSPRNSNSSQEETTQTQAKTTSNRRRRRMMATTPKHVHKPALKLSGKKGKRGGHRPKSQTCTEFDDSFLNELHHPNAHALPDLYQSIVFENGAFRSRNISMISAQQTMNENGDENVIKFTKPFNKMVADDAGNIFIGTDKYIRYITYNRNKTNESKSDCKYRKFQEFHKQEQLLYALSSDEHLVSLWNQNGKIYFVTMPYALQDIHHREYNKKLMRQWSLNLFVVENKNNLRQRSIHKYEWIPPSVHDKLPYRKLRTFRWRVKGRFIENFLSLWYDEKYETLITLAECDRLNEPQIIFLNKKNDGGLLKLKIRNNTFSIYGSDDSHGGSEDGVDNHLLIRHKPTKSWLCCVSCIDCNGKTNNNNASSDKEEECWIQFKLNRENNCINSSRIIKLPPALRNKKWLAYDKHRDCLIGINRLNIEQLLGLNAETKKNSIKLIVVPRLTKLIQNHATKQIHNKNKNVNKRKRIR